jgi:hypothetical protein
MIDDDDDDCGEIGGMRIGRGNPSTLRESASMPLFPPQIPHYKFTAHSVKNTQIFNKKTQTLCRH